MTFESAEPSHRSVLREWRAGPYTLVVMLFTFGQNRVQLWRGLNVVGPNW
jgi:hypothetical protein